MIFLLVFAHLTFFIMQWTFLKFLTMFEKLKKLLNFWTFFGSCEKYWNCKHFWIFWNSEHVLKNKNIFLNEQSLKSQIIFKKYEQFFKFASISSNCEQILKLWTLFEIVNIFLKKTNNFEFFLKKRTHFVISNNFQDLEHFLKLWIFGKNK